MLTNIYDVLRSPRKAMARIADEADIWKSLNAQTIILFINTLVNKYDATKDEPLWLTALAAVISIPIGLLVFYLLAGVTHGIARLMGGQGTWKKQFITLGYSIFPEIIFIPIEVILLALGMETAVVIVAAIACVWSLILGVYAICATQKLGIGKSCFILFAPSIIIIIIGIIYIFSVLGMQ